MIRLALPKGRNLAPTLQALRSAIRLEGLDPQSRRLQQRLAEEEVEVLMLKDWDLPLYVEHGIADLGVVGSDVLVEVDGDLLQPLRLRDGRCRLALVGFPGDLPRPGSQVRLATKYPRTTRRWLAQMSWTAEVLPLAGSVELAPLLRLADVAVDIVKTGQTLREHGLVELEVVAEVAPTVVVNRAAYQVHRRTLNRWIDALETAEVAS